MLLVLSQVLLEDGESPHVLGPGVVSLPELLSEPGELELVMVQVDGGGEGHGDQGSDHKGELHDSGLRGQGTETEPDLERVFYQQRMGSDVLESIIF